MPTQEKEIGYTDALGITIRRQHLIALVDKGLARRLVGFFLRVCVVLPDNKKAYALGRIIDVQHGVSYSGYAMDLKQSTNIVFKLDLSEDLTRGSGDLFQMVAVSNSHMTYDEWSQWCKNHAGIKKTEHRRLQTVQRGHIQRLKEPTTAQSQAEQHLAVYVDADGSLFHRKLCKSMREDRSDCALYGLDLMSTVPVQGIMREERSKRSLSEEDSMSMVLAQNTGLLNYFTNVQQQKTTASLTIGCGSLRQSADEDRRFAAQNGTPGIFEALDYLTKNIGARLDRFLLGDVFGRLKIQAFNRALLGQKISQENHPTIIIPDDTKLTLLYSLVQRAAVEGKQKVVFIDDRLDILYFLQDCLSEARNCIPSNIIVELKQYDGGEVTDVATIQGTGKIDQNYQLSTLKLAQELQDAKTSRPDAFARNWNGIGFRDLQTATNICVDLLQDFQPTTVPSASPMLKEELDDILTQFQAFLEEIGVEKTIAQSFRPEESTSYQEHLGEVIIRVISTLGARYNKEYYNADRGDPILHTISSVLASPFMQHLDALQLWKLSIILERSISWFYPWQRGTIDQHKTQLGKLYEKLTQAPLMSVQDRELWSLKEQGKSLECLNYVNSQEQDYRKDVVDYEQQVFQRLLEKADVKPSRVVTASSSGLFSKSQPIPTEPTPDDQPVCASDFETKFEVI